MTKPEQNKSSSPGRFDLLIGLLSKYRRYLVWGGVAVFLANGLTLINPYLIKIIFDRLEQSAPSEEIMWLAALMVALEVVGGLFRFMMRRTIIWMSRRIEYDIRGKLTRHLLNLSPSFYDNSRTGDLMARATNDLEAVRMMTGPAIMQGANTIVTGLVAIPLMLSLSPRLTLYALIPGILFPFLMHRMGHMVHQRFIKIQNHFSILTSTAQENIAGIRVVKAYRQEEAEIKHFSDLSRQYFHLNMSLARVMALFMPAIMLLGGLLGLMVLYVGGRDIIAGRIELGTMVAFFMYMTKLMWPMMAVGWVISLYQRGTVSLKRINDILDTKPEIVNNIPKPTATKVRGAIEYRDLSFSYNGTQVLHSVSFEASPGETIGIIGKTGSGKSTLVSLLTRLYPVKNGMLFLDGIDINEWDLHSLRSQIGFAPQEPFLFSDTVGGNIRFGRKNAPEDDTLAASQMANLDKDVSDFPAAYNTVVGERGITLSGGQKQRTAIARALLIQPAVLVLDDATSAVDTETEEAISRAIHDRPEPCTTLLISHRISSVKDSDMILYLANGTIAERGTHEELLHLNGHYASLHRAQLVARELENLS